MAQGQQGAVFYLSKLSVTNRQVGVEHATLDLSGELGLIGLSLTAGLGTHCIRLCRPTGITHAQTCNLASAVSLEMISPKARQTAGPNSKPFRITSEA
jgi:hypothetical protein